MEFRLGSGSDITSTMIRVCLRGPPPDSTILSGADPESRDQNDQKGFAEEVSLELGSNCAGNVPGKAQRGKDFGVGERQGLMETVLLPGPLPPPLPQLAWSELCPTPGVLVPGATTCSLCG